MTAEKKKGFFSRFSRKKETQEPAPALESEAVAEDLPLPAPEPEVEEEKPKQGFLSKLKTGLKKTQASLKGRLDGLNLKTRQIDDDLLEELEESLISCDIGVQTTMEIIERVRLEVDRKALKNGGELKEKIKEELLRILKDIPKTGLKLEKQPLVILVVGVNGVGKTTTIGKVANYLRNQGKSVVVCAADTFRAAAVEQLQIWAKRAGVEIVLKQGSTDPAAVVFDALERVKETSADVLLVDTAGRLHNNPNLMNELAKMRRVIERHDKGAPHHTLLILDAVTGQNGLQQARKFVEKIGVTDLIITKMDGTAKGGIAIAIAKEINLPIQFIGVGEAMDDLLPFDEVGFVDALFGED